MDAVLIKVVAPIMDVAPERVKKCLATIHKIYSF